MKDAIENLITFVPKSIKPGTFTKKLLHLEDCVETVNDTLIVDRIRDHFFHSQDIGCNTECSMAKVLTITLHEDLLTELLLQCALLLFTVPGPSIHNG
jgi:hypothetical protein